MKETQIGLAQHWGATVNEKSAGGGTCTRTYGLGRVHVRVTPREMGSVCGQHDFVDLLRLNDAIFCKGGRGQKSLCHCELWELEFKQHTGTHIT